MLDSSITFEVKRQGNAWLFSATDRMTQEIACSFVLRPSIVINDAAEMSSVRIDPDGRGTGINHLCLRKAIKFAKQQGFTAVTPCWSLMEQPIADYERRMWHESKATFIEELQLAKAFAKVSLPKQAFDRVMQLELNCVIRL